MFFLQAILAAVLRYASTILNMAFGWATTMLFGKVPARRQTLLAVIEFGSVLWLFAALGIAFPRFGAFALAFVTLPKWVNPLWIRLAMLTMAVILPAAVGVLSMFAVNEEQRPRGFAGVANAILKAYPFTLGLALTLCIMLAVAPAVKLHDVLRRWDNSHAPIMVRSDDYLEVVADIQRVLRGGGFETRRERAPWSLRLPINVMTLFAGSAIDRLVAERMTALRCPRIEVLLYPSDLVVRGRDEDIWKVRALIAEQLTFTKAYQTWSKEANQIEDRLVNLWRTIIAGKQKPEASLANLRRIEQDSKAIGIAFEEWEVLYREKLVVERRVLLAMAGLSDLPDKANVESTDWRLPTEGAVELSTK